MKKLILSIAVIVSSTSFAQTVNLDQALVMSSATSPTKSVNHSTLELSEFPNQTSSTIMISSEIGCKVEIFNMDGAHIKNLNSHCNEIINLSGMPKGFYVVRIKDSLGGEETRKVLLR
ncbi:MAG: hypothetical protein ACJAZ2_002183 [Glaciecola sp.]|jgi:hypothetical protein